MWWKNEWLQKPISGWTKCCTGVIFQYCPLFTCCQSLKACLSCLNWLHVRAPRNRRSNPERLAKSKSTRTMLHATNKRYPPQRCISSPLGVALPTTSCTSINRKLNHCFLSMSNVPSMILWRNRLQHFQILKMVQKVGRVLWWSTTTTTATVIARRALQEADVKL